MMNELIEADFFPPTVEAVKDTARALIVDNSHDAARSVEPSLNKASRSKPAFSPRDNVSL